MNRLNPDIYLSDYQSQFINKIEKSVINILDVGASPFTDLGKKHPSKILNITAIDPLAHEYDKLLEKYEIVPPIRTIYGEA